jgi:hypothetical protein
MAKRIFILLTSLLFLSLTPTNKHFKTIEKLTFLEYSNKIPLIELPLKTNCNQQLDNINLDFDDSTIALFGPTNSKIYGKLIEAKNYTAIIYLYPADIVLPIIQSTDKQGKKISTLALFEKYCGEDETSWDTSWVNINKNLIIQLNDSSITFNRDIEGKIISKTIKTKARHRQFYINNKGKILQSEYQNAL